MLAYSLDAGDKYVTYILGSINAQLGEYDKALEFYTETVNDNRPNPNNAEFAVTVRLYRAQLYLVFERYEEALADLSLYFNSNMVAQTTGRLYSGAANLHLRNFAEARRLYTSVWESSDSVDFARMFNLQGSAFRVAENHRVALITGLRQQIGSQPSDVEAIYQLATVYMELGQWQEAKAAYEEYFQKVKQPMPEDLTAILALVVS